MKEWIKAQGGNEKVVDNPEKVLSISKNTVDFKAKNSGHVTYIDTEKIGMASMYLGAGREKKEDSIDLSVGLKIFKKLGDKVEKDETIATLFISQNSNVEYALDLLDQAYLIQEVIPSYVSNDIIFDVLE